MIFFNQLLVIFFEGYSVIKKKNNKVEITNKHSAVVFKNTIIANF